MITCKELILKEGDGEIRTFYDLQAGFSYSSSVSLLCLLSHWGGTVGGMQTLSGGRGGGKSTMRCRRSDKGGRPATGFHNSESTGVLHPASWPARALEARVMRRADKQVGWGPDGWKAAALAAFIVPGASAAWSWAAPIGLELPRRSAFQGRSEH